MLIYVTFNKKFILSDIYTYFELEILILLAAYSFYYLFYSGNRTTTAGGANQTSPWTPRIKKIIRRCLFFIYCMSMYSVLTTNDQPIDDEYDFLYENNSAITVGSVLPVWFFATLFTLILYYLLHDQEQQPPEPRNSNNNNNNNNNPPPPPPPNSTRNTTAARPTTHAGPTTNPETSVHVSPSESSSAGPSNINRTTTTTTTAGPSITNRPTTQAEPAAAIHRPTNEAGSSTVEPLDINRVSQTEHSATTESSATTGPYTTTEPPAQTESNLYFYQFVNLNYYILNSHTHQTQSNATTEPIINSPTTTDNGSGFSSPTTSSHSGSSNNNDDEPSAINRPTHTGDATNSEPVINSNENAIDNNSKYTTSSTNQNESETNNTPPPLTETSSQLNNNDAPINEHTTDEYIREMTRLLESITPLSSTVETNTQQQQPVAPPSVVIDPVFCETVTRALTDMTAILQQVVTILAEILEKTTNANSTVPPEHVQPTAPVFERSTTFRATQTIPENRPVTPDNSHLSIASPTQPVSSTAEPASSTTQPVATTPSSSRQETSKDARQKSEKKKKHSNKNKPSSSKSSRKPKKSSEVTFKNQVEQHEAIKKAAQKGKWDQETAEWFKVIQEMYDNNEEIPISVDEPEPEPTPEQQQDLIPSAPTPAPVLDWHLSDTSLENDTTIKAPSSSTAVPEAWFLPPQQVNDSPPADLLEEKPMALTVDKRWFGSDVASHSPFDISDSSLGGWGAPIRQQLSQAKDAQLSSQAKSKGVRPSSSQANPTMSSNLTLDNSSFSKSKGKQPANKSSNVGRVPSDLDLNRLVNDTLLVESAETTVPDMASNAWLNYRSSPERKLNQEATNAGDKVIDWAKFDDTLQNTLSSPADPKPTSWPTPEPRRKSFEETKKPGTNMTRNKSEPTIKPHFPFPLSQTHCRHWNHCKNPFTCHFSHPEKDCDYKHEDDCPYGDKCSFIHHPEYEANLRIWKSRNL